MVRALALLPVLAGCLDFDGARIRGADGGPGVDLGGSDGGGGGDGGGPHAFDSVLLSASSAIFAEVQRHAADGTLLGDFRVEPGAITIASAGGASDNLLLPSAALGKPERCAGISQLGQDESYKLKGSISLLVTNSVAVQLQGTWSGTNGLNGVTTWTFLPDGRIHRHESTRVATPPAAPQWLTAYTALDNSALRGLTAYSVIPAGGYAPLGNNMINMAPGNFVCGLAPKVVIGWAQSENTASGPGNAKFTLRLWSIPLGVMADQTTPQSILMASDWVQNAPVPVGTYSGDVLMFFEARGARCVGDCDCVSEKAKVWSDALTVQMGPAPPLVFDPTSGYYTVDLKGTNPAQWKWKITGGNAPTLVLRVNNAPGPIKHVRLNPASANRDLPFATVLDNGTAWVYLPPLAGGVRATNEVQLVP